MVQKPKIQYIGQFYVYGSEARALEQPERKPIPILRKPLEKLEQIEKIHIDPVALIAISVSIFMLATMFLGMQQLETDWAEYQEMAQRVEVLRDRNHEKMESYHEHYKHSMVRAKATAMGMIPKAEAEHMVVEVTAPEAEPEATWMENVQWFLKGLFA